jgi:hypothetical protein
MRRKMDIFSFPFLQTAQTPRPEGQDHRVRRPRFANLRKSPSLGGVNIRTKRKILREITNHEHRQSNFIRRGGFSSL